MPNRVYKMRELCEITSSKRIYAADYKPEGVPFYRGKEISEKFKGNLDVSTELFIDRDKFEQIRHRFGAPVGGDLLLTSVGTLGSPYVVNNGEEFYFKDGNLTWFRKFNHLESRFLYYWLQSSQGKAELKKCTIGSSQSAYTIVLLKEMEITLPPLPIQQKIAAILSAYDELIENNLRRIKILEEMAQNLYREWFVKFRFPGHEQARFVDSPLGRIPAGWEVVAFTDIADVLSGGTPSTTVEEYWSGSIPFFAPKDAPESFYVTNTEKSITALGLKKCNSKLYQKDTVFITARGTVGKVVMPSIDMAMNQSCYALRGKEGISQLYLFLATKDKVEYLKKNTGGATFDTIVVDTFKRMLVAKPCREVIDQFSCLSQAVIEMILNVLKKNTTLRRTRDMLLPRLISGEVDVSELDITIPEEAVA